MRIKPLLFAISFFVFFTPGIVLAQSKCDSLAADLSAYNECLVNDGAKKSSSNKSSSAPAPTGITNFPTPPKIDQRCWTEEACKGARASLGGSATEIQSGFYQGSDAIAACGSADVVTGETLGFCLPSTRAVTQITFGGKNEFLHLGEFIQVMFRYSINIAGLASVVMIIVASLMWITSGGNSERISSAKKKISGAITGLVLALFSITLLNTINPFLTDLRLPQIWMINPVALIPGSCNQVSESTKLAVLSEFKGELITSEMRKQRFTQKTNASYIEKQNLNPECGREYYVAGGAGATCQGFGCASGSTCVQFDQTKAPECIPAILAGTIGTSSASFCPTDITKNNIIDNDLELIAMCSDGDLESIATIDIDGEESENHRFVYRFGGQLKSAVTRACDGDDDTKFFLGAEINDENGWAGSNPCYVGEFTTAGIDDWFAIGKDGPESNTCGTNLAFVAYGIKNNNAKPDCTGDKGVTTCSCGAVSDEPIIRDLMKTPAYTNHLITKKELLDGFSCNIHVTRGQFPDIDNADIFEDDTDCFENN